MSASETSTAETSSAETSTVAASLKVIGGKQDGQTLPLPKGKFLIGREEDCHLRPNSDLVSRHHCVFSTDEFSVRLRDLGSTNGTLINGERLSGARTLKAGDRVTVGKLEFEVVLAGGSAPETDAADVATGGGLDDVLAAAADADAAPASEDKAETAPGGETMIDIPTMPVEQFGQPAAPNSDTAYNADLMPPPGGMPPQQQQPMFGYPQQMPYGVPQPGYGMPPGYPPQQFPGYPPQGYPQQPYPPQGYPPQGYPQQPYPPQGYPPQDAPPPEAEEPEPEEEPQPEGRRVPQVSLPDPTQTGAKAPEPKPEKKPGEEGQSGGSIPDVASGIIKQYFERRPKSGG